jgi:hypothetical protein
MQRRKVQVTVERDGLLIPEGARAHVRERSSRQSFVADLRSIVAAAHKLPADVDPPARIWTSLRAQLEREGILGRKEIGRFDKGRNICTYLRG